MVQYSEPGGLNVSNPDLQVGVQQTGTIAFGIRICQIIEVWVGHKYSRKVGTSYYKSE
jgi:hypothetical protein